jgi:LysM repeat protein
MMKSFLWLFLCLFISFTAQATGDSLRYLTPKDTIILLQGNYGEKIFKHQLEHKQTLFSLAKFYGLTLNELYYFNPSINPQVGAKVGTHISIPIPNRAILRYLNPEMNAGDFIKVYYEVQKGDNLYRLSKYTFKMPKEVIKQRNGLISESLKRGQLLHIGWMSLYGVPKVLREQHGGPMWDQSNSLGNTYAGEGYGKKERTHNGIANWPKDENLKSKDLYALHRSAKVNSTISITNPMTQKRVFAKVIGRVPPRYDDNVIAVVSPGVAKLLGAIDANFFVEIKYWR